MIMKKMPNAHMVDGIICACCFLTSKAVDQKDKHHHKAAAVFCSGFVMLFMA